MRIRLFFLFLLFFVVAAHSQDLTPPQGLAPLPQNDSDLSRYSAEDRRLIQSIRSLRQSNKFDPSMEEAVKGLLEQYQRLLKLQQKLRLADGGNVSGGSDNAIIQQKPLSLTEEQRRPYEIFQLKLLGLTSSASAVSVQKNPPRVVVIDSGIVPESRVAKNIVEFQDFTGLCPRQKMCDESLHGTLVTDLVVQAYPQAEVIALKVLKKGAQGDFQHVMQALRWVRSNYKKYNIKVVNLSLTSPEQLSGFMTDADRARALTQELIGKGIIFVSAVGNDFEKTVEYFPASMRDVITVGSYNHNFTEDKSQHTISPFANKGTAPNPQTKEINLLIWRHTERVFNGYTVKPDLLGPGENLVACATDCYLLSGTSFAAGLISGGILRVALQDSSMTGPLFLETLFKSNLFYQDWIPGTRNPMYHMDFQSLFPNLQF